MVESNLTIAEVPVLQIIGENILFAIIIILLGLVIGKIVGAALNRLFIEIEMDKNIGKIRKSSFSLGRAISGLVSFLIYVAAIILALLQLEILNTVILIVIYSAIIIALGAFILSLTDFLPNFFSGINIRAAKIAPPGKKIIVKNVEGQVIKTGILHTRLKNKEGEIFSVPNSLLFQSKKK